MAFSTEDRDNLQRLVFDAAAEPAFELLKSCLVWPDERPDRISNPGYQVLCDLWIARGFMHRGVPSDQWGLDPAYFQRVWKQALGEIPDWPGFKRLRLSGADDAYLARCLAEVSTADVY